MILFASTPMTWPDVAFAAIVFGVLAFMLWLILR